MRVNVGNVGMGCRSRIWIWVGMSLISRDEDVRIEYSSGETSLKCGVWRSSLSFILATFLLSNQT